MGKVIEMFKKLLRTIFTFIPIASLLVTINFIIEALVPVSITYIISKLVSSINLYFNNNSGIDDIKYWMFIFVGVFIIKGLNSSIYSISLNAYLFEKLNNILEINLVRKASKISILSYENPEILNIKRRAESAVENEVIPMVYYKFLEVFKNFIIFISMIVALSTFDYRLSFISIIATIPHFINRLVRGKEFYKIKEFQSEDEREKNYLYSLIAGKDTNKELRVYDKEKYIKKKYMNTLFKLEDKLWKFKLHDNRNFALCEIFVILGFAISLSLSLKLMIDGAINVGQFSALILGLENLSEASKNFLINVGAIPSSLLFANNYFDFLELEEENLEEGYKLAEIRSIEFKNVSFTYPNTTKKALSNVSFEIKSGESIVIVGENGSGKTTIKNLILNLYDSYDGDILINDMNINDISKNSLYMLTSTVNQNIVDYKLKADESILLEETDGKNNKEIDDNLSYLSLDHLKDKEGYKRLGKEFNGLELSTGQWQRLTLARSNITNSKLKLFDEPTSSLDPLEENKILKDIIKQSKKDPLAISIIISHRLGLAKFADKILVMKEGKLLGVGDHNTLIKNNPEYIRLYNSQSKWYKD